MKNTSAKLRTTLKHLFVPHEGNDHRPHFFREHVVLSMLTAVLFLLIISFTSYSILRTTTYGSSVATSVLTDLTNTTRKENNLPPFAPNQRLTEAAKHKGEDMLSRQYFAHYAQDGTSPWMFIRSAGYPFIFAGENLAINFKHSKEVQKAWMLSQKHRENILNKNYEDIGIATVHGTLEGKQVTLVVEMFGKEKTEGQGLILPQSSWYQRILFDMSYYISTLYIVFVVFLLVATCSLILIEFRRQHFIHVVYGVLLIGLTLICIAINSLFL